MLYLELPGNDPAFNLALEESLLINLPRESEGIFLLWQNSPAIIIGRHQVAAEVVDTGKIQEANLPVIRRISGGGAVYHDSGNLNFSFMDYANREMRIDFRRFLEPVRLALADLGIESEISGRNDLEAAGKKISGSGQILRARKILHHGTLLFNADLNAMHNFLRVSDAKFRSRGIASQHARTANLLALCAKPFSLGDLKEALIRRCAHAQGSLEPAILAAAERLANARYRSWDWNYGQSPKYDLEKQCRFAWGEVAIHLQTSGGRIKSCRISGDFFSNSEVAELEARFIDLPFEQAAFARALDNCRWEKWFAGCDEICMSNFFLRELFA